MDRGWSRQVAWGTLKLEVPRGIDFHQYTNCVYDIASLLWWRWMEGSSIET